LNNPQYFEEAYGIVCSEISFLLSGDNSNILEFGEIGVAIRANDEMALIKTMVKKGQNSDELENHWIQIAKLSIVAIMLRRGWFDFPSSRDILQ
jgi:hypothetical protein